MMDLTQAREAIDALDKEITALLAKRFHVVDAVSDYKEENGLAVYDPAREERIIQRIKGACEEAYAEDVAQVYRRLFEVSRARQERRQKASN